MSIPTPRDVAEAREVARLHRELDAIVMAVHIREWNAQVDAVVDVILTAAHDGTGVVIEFSYDDNVLRAFPEPRLGPGSAALFNLDTGLHHYREIHLNQIRSTRP